MHKRHIKLLSPSYSEVELNAVSKVIKSGWWGLGPVTAEFEEKFAEFVGAKYAIAVNSATSALHLALHMAPRKGKVIIPAFTFVSVAAVVLYEQCEVVFADIDEETHCLDPQDVRLKLDNNTAAVIAVHHAGTLADINYGSHNATIIEDCAHAVGTKYAGKNSQLACWSFHPVKNIATGDGGMITTDNEALAARLRKLRWLGIDASTYDRTGKKGYNWEYTIDELGFKYHANDIMSAIGLAQLRRIKELNGRRKKIADIYNKELLKLPLILPPESGSWHLYVVRVEKKYRNKLIDFMRKQNIATGVHYKPLYYYPIFQWDIKEKGKQLPITEKIWQEVVSLPIYPDLSEQDQKRVIATLKKFFN